MTKQQKRALDPSKPLLKDRQEKFAVGMSQSKTLGQAYLDAIPAHVHHSGDINAAKVSGHRWMKIEAMKNRVDWLIADENRRKQMVADQLADDKQAYSKGDVGRLFIEVSDALREAFSVGQNSSTPPAELEKIRRVWSEHEARVAKIVQDRPALSNEEAKTDNAELNRAIETWEMCQCHM